MKKVLALLLCVALAVTSLITAFAASPKFECTVSDKSVKMGDTFTVTVSISNYEPIRGGALLFTVDRDVFTVISGEWLIKNTTMALFDSEQLTATFASSNFQAQDINGDIFCLTLKAKEDLNSAGSVDIFVEPQLTNADDENIAEGVTGKTSIFISCMEHKYGNLIPEVPAKCGIAGKKAYYECSVCHKLFNESKTEVTAEQLVIPATGEHVDADGDWEWDATYHWRTCECGAIFNKEVHCGGEATDSSKAVCSVCRTEYGELIFTDEIIGIEITPPTKVNYLLGEKFEAAGLVVRNVYRSGKKAETTGSYDLPDMQTVRNFVVFVTANGFSDSFIIRVSTKGDINADGKVSLADVITAARTAVGAAQNPNSAEVVFGDVIGSDARVTLADVLKLARVSLGIDIIE